MFFGMPEALFPAIAYELGGAGGSVSLRRAAVGSLLATATSGWTGHVHRHGAAVFVAATGWGVGIVLFGLAPDLPLALAGLVLAGGADMISGIFRSTIWNQTIPDGLRGRLAGIEQVSYSTGPLLGNVEAGGVACSRRSRSIVSGGLMCIAGVRSCSCCCRPSGATTPAAPTPRLTPWRSARAAARRDPDRFRLCGFCGTPSSHGAGPPARDPKDGHDRVLEISSARPHIGERLDSGIAPRGHVALLRRDEGGDRTARRDRREVHRRRRDGRLRHPGLHEDDALRAVRAADEIQAALAGLNAELEARFGVSAPEADRREHRRGVPGDPAAGQRLVTGDPSTSPPGSSRPPAHGETLIGALTRVSWTHAADARAGRAADAQGQGRAGAGVRLAAVRAPRRPRPQPARGPRRGAGDLRAVLDAVSPQARPDLC